MRTKFRWIIQFIQKNSQSGNEYRLAERFESGNKHVAYLTGIRADYARMIASVPEIAILVEQIVEQAEIGMSINCEVKYYHVPAELIELAKQILERKFEGD